jgi:hypothetical protein
MSANPVRRGILLVGYLLKNNLILWPHVPDVDSEAMVGSCEELAVDATKKR